jgi:uncharacterized protein (DUF433 family)
MNRLRSEHRASLVAGERELAKLEARRKKLVESITEGVPGSEVKDELIAIAARREELQREHAGISEPKPLLHPEMAAIYRTKVTERARARQELSSRLGVKHLKPLGRPTSESPPRLLRPRTERSPDSECRTARLSQLLERSGFDLACGRGWLTIDRRRSQSAMPQLTRITRDPAVMGGKPCIRGMRVTVGTVVGLVAAGRTRDEILREYPYLEDEDIAEALSYAAWRAEEVEVPLRQP